MKRIPILGLVLLLLTGCPEARYNTGRTVTLLFPETAKDSKVEVSVNDDQVQEALRLVDKVLVADGFIRDTGQPVGNGLLANYAKFNATGLRQPDTPAVFLQRNRLQVIIRELGNRTGRPSTKTKDLCHSLQKELARRFGGQRVSASNTE